MLTCIYSLYADGSALPTRKPRDKRKKPVQDDTLSASDEDISFADALGIVPPPVDKGNNVFKVKSEWIPIFGVESDGKVMIEGLQDRMLNKYYVDDMEPLRYGIFLYIMIDVDVLPGLGFSSRGVRLRLKTVWSCFKIGLQLVRK
jgi:hypothetical protein